MNDTSQNGSGPAQQRRRLCAIMFTDIKGFSSLMESDEVTAVGLVKAQREIIRKYIAIHGGEERETIGDAFLVIFDSAVNAVRCAIDIQRDIWEFNQTREPEKQVWIRIGIHLGDILIEEGSVFGEGVNLAARVEPLAEPGGISITRQVFDQVRHHLKISVTHLGVRELKNITDVPDIYRIRLSTTAPREPISLREHLRWFVETPVKTAATASVLAFVIAANIYWSFFVPHTHYARVVAFIRHAPHPRFVVGKRDVRTLNHYYTLTKKGGRVVRLEEVTKPQVLPQDAREAWEFGFAKRSRRDFPVHEYIYDRGKIREEHIFDEYGTLQYKLIYEQDGKIATVHDSQGFIRTFENQIAGFAYEFDEKGRTTKLENKNAFGMLRNDSLGVAAYRYSYDDVGLPIETSSYDINGNPIENKDGIAITKNTYNRIGLIEREVFMDRYKAVRESLDGIAAIDRSFDDKGHLVLEKYSDRAGEPSLSNDGSCGRSFTYDDQGRLVQVATLSCTGSPKATRLGLALVSYTYDGPRVTKESFFDEKGLPTANTRGVAATEVAFDDKGRVASLTFLGPDGNGVTDSELVHSIRYSYDERGRPATRAYMGLDGKPTISDKGYAEVRMQYNERGDAIEWAYFDTAGTFINVRDGYAIVRNEYDQFGNIVARSFFDKQSEPTIGLGTEACHRTQTKFDERGNVTEVRCFDGEGRLTPGIKKCAITNYGYDPYGKLARLECYISEGTLIDNPTLPSILTIRYDKRGYVSEVASFGPNGEPAERYQGAAVWKCTSDDYGNQIEIATYDRNGNLISNPKYRAAIFRREFDEKGHELKALAFGQDGTPSLGIWGFAEVRYKYDAMGHKTSEAYFDGDGRPTQNSQGVHERKTNYDNRGRAVEIANLDALGQPIEGSDGFAFAQYTYNESSVVVGIDYMDKTQGLTQNKRLLAASQKFRTDDRGNVLEIRRLDTRGELCTQKECIAITSQEFDDKGRMIKQVFKDSGGTPTMDTNGAFGYRNEYDVAGKISAQHILGADGLDGVDRDGVHGLNLHYRPDTGQLMFITFGDSNEKKTLTTRGARMRIILYDPLYLERQRARVDVTESGKVVTLRCLDEAGNESDKKDCIAPLLEIKAEVEKIKPMLLED